MATDRPLVPNCPRDDPELHAVARALADCAARSGTLFPGAERAVEDRRGASADAESADAH